MSISALQAAKAICQLRDWEVSHLEVQKILYIAQLIFVGKQNRSGSERELKSLINEDFQAWALGPVVEELYHELKATGYRKIKETDFSGSFEKELDKDECQDEYAAIKTACRLSEDIDAMRLVAFTHDDKGAWQNYYDEDMTHVVIPNSEIYNEYARRTKRID